MLELLLTFTFVACVGILILVVGLLAEVRKLTPAPATPEIRSIFTPVTVTDDEVVEVHAPTVDSDYEGIGSYKGPKTWT